MTNTNNQDELREILQDLVNGKGFSKRYPNTPLSPRVEDSANVILGLITKAIAKAEVETIDTAIGYIRSQKVSGSFSEGCECEKCDAYEKVVRKDLRRLIK